MLLPIFVQTTKQCNKKSNIKDRCKTAISKTDARQQAFHIPNIKTLFELFENYVARVHCLWFCDEKCVLNDGMKEAGSPHIQNAWHILKSPMAGYSVKDQPSEKTVPKASSIVTYTLG